MTRTAAVFVPRMPKDDQKQTVCKGLQDQAKKNRNFVSKIFLFPKMKSQLKGQKFDDIAGHQAEQQALLDSITNRKLEG
jgi:hypothetical protein